MIQPISHQLAAIAAGTPPAPNDRPAAATPPADRVNAAGDAQSVGTSTTGADTRQAARGTPSTSLDKALESVNQSLQAWSTGMRFEMDDDAQRLVVSIIDSSTGEVLRKVPSDAVLRVAKMIVQLQGTRVDTRA